MTPHLPDREGAVMGPTNMTNNILWPLQVTWKSCSVGEEKGAAGTVSLKKRQDRAYASTVKPPCLW